MKANKCLERSESQERERKRKGERLRERKKIEGYGRELERRRGREIGRYSISFFRGTSS